ncbi:MAG: ATP-binding cassette domain-containing protein [Jiangellaceae bacterium]
MTRAPTVRFEDVTFGYRQTGPPALDSVNFSVDAGETLAIVGASGAGKTTIASLLLRFLRPAAGSHPGRRD